MLYVWVRAGDSGRPITLEEILVIFSGPNGQFRNILQDFNHLRAEAAVDEIIAE